MIALRFLPSLCARPLFRVWFCLECANIVFGGGGDTPHNKAVVKFVGGVAALMIMARFDNSDGRRMARTDDKDRPDTRAALTKKIVRRKQTARANGSNGQTIRTTRVQITKLNKIIKFIDFQ